MYEFLQYRVSHVMTRDVVTVGRDETIRAIEEIFATHEFNSLPVVGDGGELLGVVTKLDVLKAFVFDVRSPIPHYDEIVELPAESIYTRDPLTTEPDEPVTRVLDRMVRTRVKSFPVVTGRRVVGIVSREDVLGALRRAAAGLRPGA